MLIKANFVLYQEEKSADVLQEINCKEIWMGMCVRSAPWKNFLYLPCFIPFNQ